jgi:hypothetical protein
MIRKKTSLNNKEGEQSNMPVICIIARIQADDKKNYVNAIIEIQNKIEIDKFGDVRRELDVFLPDGEKLKSISLFEVDTSNLGRLLEALTMAHNQYLKVVPGFEFTISVGYDHDEFIDIDEKMKIALA